MCQSFVPLLQLSIEHFEGAAAPGSTIMKISGQRMMLEAINGFLSRKLLIVLVVGLGTYFTLKTRFVDDARMRCC
ncbi:amino acid transport-related membrane protein [Pseudomonas putida TRO1]|uniref:Amino acid transport-related membrane protein n=1 Tax=Pseudomonas putida TRO1 TaxID=1227924 RepID=A0AAD2W501_PSEPU|nr:amino acid transport-related membrane protein [Pseudomonas putida TRO1]PKF27640.1 amino acid transporter [Pseudomonas hunanensis]